VSAPASRGKEFFKGFFWPLLFGALGLATYPLWASYDEAHGIHNVGSEAVPAAALLAVVGSAALMVRWWKSARWRAYGILAGLPAAAPLLAVLLIGFLMLFKVQILPK